MNASEIRDCLRYHYSDAEWELMFEVLDATGGRSSRSCDALAMNTWPSRGFALHGHEIKVSRSDWLSELKNPAKADKIASFCDYWWLVAPAEIVIPDELPLGWGLMVPKAGNNKKGLTVIKRPDRLTPQPFTRAFVASMVRNVARAESGVINKAVGEALQAEREKLNERIESAVKERARKSTELIERVRKFEEQTGLKLSDWSYEPDLGKRVNLVKQLGSEWEGLPHIAKDLRRIVDVIEKTASPFKLEKEGTA